MLTKNSNTHKLIVINKGIIPINITIDISNRKIVLCTTSEFMFKFILTFRIYIVPKYV